VLNKLYKHTPDADDLGVNMVALVRNVAAQT